MTTFQAIVLAIIHGISEFLPINSKAHQVLLPLVVGWQQPTGSQLACFSLGGLLALLIYFRHDWASMISSLLQVILYRKRPKTVDERLPLFLVASTLPLLLATPYFRSWVRDLDWSPLRITTLLVALSAPLWFFDYWSRKIKNIYDWNWIDAIFVGIIQCSAILPGVDLFSVTLIGIFLRNYQREAAVKYAYFAALPMLIYRVSTEFKEISFSAPAPAPEMSWLSFGTATVVSLFVGLLAIGGFTKHVQNKGMGQYFFYRIFIGAGIFGLYWVRGSL
ncbi:MAG: undecaprenyl-diphosphate phosphatase [Bdellovibrionia bacterium]